MPRRLSFDVVDGSGRIYVQSMAGEPGRGLSGANDDDSVLVAVVGWHGDVFAGRGLPTNRKVFASVDTPTTCRPRQRGRLRPATAHHAPRADKSIRVP